MLSAKPNFKVKLYTYLVTLNKKAQKKMYFIIVIRKYSISNYNGL